MPAAGNPRIDKPDVDAERAHMFGAIRPGQPAQTQQVGGVGGVDEGTVGVAQRDGERGLRAEDAAEQAGTGRLERKKDTYSP